MKKGLLFLFLIGFFAHNQADDNQYEIQGHSKKMYMVATFISGLVTAFNLNKVDKIAPILKGERNKLCATEIEIIRKMAVEKWHEEHIKSIEGGFSQMIGAHSLHEEIRNEKKIYEQSLKDLQAELNQLQTKYGFQRHLVKNIRMMKNKYYLIAGISGLSSWYCIKKFYEQ